MGSSRDTSAASSATSGCFFISHRFAELDDARHNVTGSATLLRAHSGATFPNNTRWKLCYQASKAELLETCRAGSLTRCKLVVWTSQNDRKHLSNIVGSQPCSHTHKPWRDAQLLAPRLLPRSMGTSLVCFRIARVATPLLWHNQRPRLVFELRGRFDESLTPRFF